MDESAQSRLGLASSSQTVANRRNALPGFELRSWSFPSSSVVHLTKEDGVWNLEFGLFPNWLLNCCF
jgi:hypothetical protein